MNPPPPILPAAGYVTARANAVATAASTALPPCFKTSTPTSLAGAETETTMPCRASTAFSAARPGTKQHPASRATDSRDRTFIAVPLQSETRRSRLVVVFASIPNATALQLFLEFLHRVETRISLLFHQHLRSGAGLALGRFGRGGDDLGKRTRATVHEVFLPL